MDEDYLVTKITIKKYKELQAENKQLKNHIGHSSQGWADKDCEICHKEEEASLENK